MSFVYKTKGVCPKYITVSLEDDVVKEVQFDGGCDGNLKAISRVTIGMTVQQIEDYFSDVTCEEKGTSCSAQLAKAVRSALNAAEQNETEKNSAE